MVYRICAFSVCKKLIKIFMQCICGHNLFCSVGHMYSIHSVCIQYMSSLESPADTLRKTATHEKTVKPSLHTSGERLQIMTLKSHSTVSDEPDALHTALTQDTNSLSDEINQLIDYIVDSGSFPYPKIAFLCLTPQQQRTEMFKRILAEHDKARGTCYMYSCSACIQWSLIM